MDEPELLTHLERHLGPALDGYRFTDPKSGESLVPIARFANQPMPPATTLVTMGLSNMPLAQRDSYIRQELLTSYIEGKSDVDLPVMLAVIADSIVRTGKAVKRGDRTCISPLFPSSRMDSVYFTSPTYFDDALAICKETDPVTVIVWAILIYKSEREFVDTNGWSAFEDRIVKEDPNLLDLTRPPFV